MRLIVGISGASGVIMGYELLRALKGIEEVESHLVMTKSAERTFSCETELSLEEVRRQADVWYEADNLGADISSGSFRTEGMIVIPCSMKTVAGIVSGYSENLLLRAADVCLKEDRRVVLVPREMPLSRIHLRNLLEASESGCQILPPVLTFYNGADSVEKQVQHIIGKLLMQFNLVYKHFLPWKQDKNSSVFS
ncbi:MAG: UbiX family flavin prenyltransferase [Selenomonadaceae bacterium]|nr:UbiX family flavin prenyltransferase [Selenomonadaceae bacterium]